MQSLLMHRRFLVVLGVVSGLVFLYFCFQAELHTWAYTALTAALVLLLVFVWGNQPFVLAGWVVVGLLRLVETFLLAPGTGGVLGRVLVLAYLAATIVFILGKRLRRAACVVMAGLFWLRLMQLDPPRPQDVRDGLVLLYALGSFGLLFFGGVGLVSQFVLPVQRAHERLRVFGRLLLYIVGRHGPALFVKHAELVAASGELKRRGPGLILIGSNSAVVLEREAALPPPPWAAGRTPRPPVRIEGPGLAFTDVDESLRAQDLLDLRRQSRAAIGVMGATRDGLEVAATVRVTFTLAPPAPDASPASRHRPAYPLNRESAFRAVYGRAADAADAVRWTELPLVVAKEIYRERLAQKTLEQLLRPNAPDWEEDPLAGFRSDFEERVKTNLLLKERGIQVWSAGISQLSFPKQGEQASAVEQQRIQNWLAEWQKREQEVRAGGDLVAIRIKQRARIEAQKEWLARLAEAMQMSGTEPKQVVVLRLCQALETAASDPSTRRLLPRDTIRMLENIREWLKFDEAPPPVIPPVAARQDGPSGTHG